MKLTTETLSVLSRCETDGETLRLPAKLDRTLYLSVSKVLKGLQGKWVSSKQAFVFPHPVDDILEQIINTGDFVPTRQAFQFFPTPDALARRMVEMAEIRPGERCLEPSAGRGNIAKYMPGCDCIELNPDNRRALVAAGFNVIGEDFMQFNPENKYDVIVMNPPFTKGQDVDHITKAIGLASRRVVAIASASVLFMSSKKHQDFRTLIETLGGSIEELPAKTFRESGTSVNTVLISIDK